LAASPTGLLFFSKIMEISMTRNSVATALVFSLLSIVSWPSEKGKSDKEAVLGTWEPVKIEKDGKEDPLPKDPGQWIFAPEKVTTREPGEVDNDCTYKLNPDKKPKELDVTGKNIAGNIVTAQFIYELDGDTLRVAVSKEGLAGKRPTGFGAKDIVIITYKRRK
jgi:uncharacterized protein (TIGR03067 family)